MVDTAAWLRDMVLEGLPVRQWVMTLPWSIRRAVAFNSKLSSALLRAFICAVHRQLGASAGADARFGAVTVVQRFGGALNLNPHFHTIIPSVAFYQNPDGSVRTEALPEPTPGELECILAEFICASQQLLMKHGLDIEIDAVSEALASASARQTQLFGPQPGRRVERVAEEAPVAGPAPYLSIQHAGFSLNAR
ncbi:transposase [Myxococcota bacterium]|nr:transposase [Myxococcota bacterium]MBU1898645.1 transposase [Myxococcota bacterium]